MDRKIGLGFAVCFGLAVQPCRSANAAELLVPSQYPTIQAAVDAAEHGDIVLVEPGVYHEAIDLSFKSIDLLGWDAILDGSGLTGPVVRIEGGYGSIIAGFTIRNGWYGEYLQESSLRGGGAIYAKTQMCK